LYSECTVEATNHTVRISSVDLVLEVLTTVKTMTVN